MPRKSYLVWLDQGTYVGIPPLPEGKHYSAKMTARDVERMLLADGFRPIDAKTKRQLIAAGHWGMPEE